MIHIYIDRHIIETYNKRYIKEVYAGGRDDPPPAEGQAANQRVIIAYTTLNHDT